MTAFSIEVTGGEFVPRVDPQVVADEVRALLARYNSCCTECAVTLTTTKLEPRQVTYTGRF